MAQDATPRHWWSRLFGAAQPRGLPASPEPLEELDTDLGRDMLRLMIARKRQNDAIRQREFDYLRKLRKQAPALQPQSTDLPSLFPDSVPYHAQERTVTLEKINEIEAQFSHQWWHGVPSTRPPGAPLPSTLPGAPASVAQAAQARARMASAASRPAHWPASTREFVPTRMPSAWSRAPLAQVREPSPAYVAASPAWNAPDAWADPVEDLSDPELDEAAIRYANHDLQGAEAVLLAALQGPPARADQVQAWLSALFDLYRATGQQARFDHMAIEFAHRFGRSAPAWIDLAQVVSLSEPPVSTVESGAQVLWRSPAELDVQAVQALRALVAQAQSDKPGERQVLDWHALNTLHPLAQQALADLLDDWCDQPLVLQMQGADHWLRCLQALTLSSDRSVPVTAWVLRLQALRVLGLQQAFELVALDYCVTYEVSPPSWQAPRCLGRNDALQEAPTGDPVPGEAPATAQATPGTAPTLQGLLLGDVSAVLARFEPSLATCGRLVIACPYLLRVDFPAAGCILNWVRQQHGLGREVQLREVPRMVAVFLRLVGIDEYARIVPRQT